MNGNLARCTGCWGTTRVDFGSYSSMVIVWASARLHDRNAAKENLMGLGNILQEGISDFRCWISDLRLRLPEAAAGFEIRNPTSSYLLPRALSRMRSLCSPLRIGSETSRNHARPAPCTALP